MDFELFINRLHTLEEQYRGVDALAADVIKGIAAAAREAREAWEKEAKEF